jgi:hypothetical protein
VALVSGGDITREIPSSTFQGKNPRSSLNLLSLAMPLLNALFCECGLSLCRKPMIYDQAKMMLVHYFFLRGIAIGEAGLLVLS